jgi:hypothetical protein
VLTALEKPRSVRTRGRPCLRFSVLFFVLLFSSIPLCSYSLVPFLKLSFHFRCLIVHTFRLTNMGCLLLSRQWKNREKKRVEVSALVCSQQLLEEDQSDERQPISTNPTEVIHSDLKKRCEEKDSLSFPTIFSFDCTFDRPLNRSRGVYSACNLFTGSGLVKSAAGVRINVCSDTGNPNGPRPTSGEVPPKVAFLASTSSLTHAYLGHEQHPFTSSASSLSDLSQ